MTTQPTRFPFIDAVHAAELLHVSQDAILDWVKEGKLRTMGGKPSNPFLRSTDVLALQTELGLSGDEPPRRVKSATAKVQTRLTADSRWSEVSEEEIRDWATRADVSRRSAARVAVAGAMAGLNVVLRVLDELE